MSINKKMFPITQGKDFIDVPLTADELTAMATIFEFCNSAMFNLISVAEKNNETEFIEKYKALQTLSKHFYNKVATISAIGDNLDSATKH